jgi:hypothetical protein
MAVSLNPRRGYGVDRFVAAYFDEVPHPKKRSWQQHENQAGDDVGHQ